MSHWNHIRVRCLLAGMLVLVLGFGPGDCRRLAADTPNVVSPAQFRAACMRYFVLGATWPATRFESKLEPVRIAIVGRTDFVPLLNKLLAGETVAGGDGGSHPVEIVEVESVDDLTDFHLVYFSKLDRESREALGRLGDRPVVTVGETPDFARAGSVLAFEIKDGKSVYIYNSGAMLAAKIRLSTDLLRLGRPAEEKGDSK